MNIKFYEIPIRNIITIISLLFSLLKDISSIWQTKRRIIMKKNLEEHQEVMYTEHLQITDTCLAFLLFP